MGPPTLFAKCESWSKNYVAISFTTKNWSGQIWNTFEIFKNEKALFSAVMALFKML
jgi:hypothetical protein